MPVSVGFTFRAWICGWFDAITRLIGMIRRFIASSERRWSGECAETVSPFRERYPEFYVTSGDKILTLEEQLEADEGIVLDEAPVPDSIWYRGAYDPLSDIVAGIWQIREREIWLSSRGQRFMIRTGASSGKWSMRRDHS